jgi:hypothetical protein
MAPTSSASAHFLFQLCFSLLVAVAYAQDQPKDSSIVPVPLSPADPIIVQIPQLAPLTHPDPKNARSLGNQDFGRCCLKAIYDSYELTDGNVTPKPNGFTTLTVDNLQKGQFPCGATYQGAGDQGAPLVNVPYSWCRNNCPGWQHSSDADLSAWITPFVGFILPAAVFCLNVTSPTATRLALMVAGSKEKRAPNCR